MSFISLLAAGGKALLAAADDLEGDLESLADSSMASSAWVDWAGLGELLIRFVVNIFVVGIIVRLFYYPKSRRRDYLFTFTLISISVFLLIFLMGGVKLKIGFALGLFAIFGIIRYRTESVPIREMTYLFLIIAVSAINALATSISYLELGATNLLFLISIWVCESKFFIKNEASKLIKYDNVRLITPEKNDELIEDLKKRTGLDISRVEVGAIDFLKDSAILRIYYKPLSGQTNSVDSIGRMPRG